MADNTHYYGFRWSHAANSRPMPQPEERAVADAYQAQDDASGFNVNLNPGDPVKLVSDGTVALANTTDAIYGIMVAVSSRGVFDSTIGQGGAMKPSRNLPGGTTGGGLLERQSRILVVPASAGVWEIDVNNNTSYTTEAAYQAAIGENANHVCVGVQANSEADPRLDATSVNTTNTLTWRIVGISNNESNQDFTGENVKLYVRINVSQEAGASASGNAVDGV